MANNNNRVANDSKKIVLVRSLRTYIHNKDLSHSDIMTANALSELFGRLHFWEGYIKRLFKKVFQHATLFHYVLAHLVKYNKS